jgi:hypothetical protein
VLTVWVGLVGSLRNGSYVQVEALKTKNFDKGADNFRAQAQVDVVGAVYQYVDLAADSFQLLDAHVAIR